LKLDGTSLLIIIIIIIIIISAEFSLDFSHCGIKTQRTPDDVKRLSVGPEEGVYRGTDTGSVSER
jgi:hypothetical protein